VQQHLAADDPARRRDQAQDRQRRHTFAAAGLAYDPQNTARRHVEGHAVDCAHNALFGVKVRLEVLYLEERFAHASNQPSAFS
jgi:hypothetical protein